MSSGTFFNSEYGKGLNSWKTGAEKICGLIFVLLTARMINNMEAAFLLDESTDLVSTNRLGHTWLGMPETDQSFVR